MSPIVAVLVAMAYSLIYIFLLFFSTIVVRTAAEDRAYKKKKKTIQKEIGFERNNTQKYYNRPTK